MLCAPIPADEHQRLAELEKLDVLRGEPEAAFDRVTAALARIFGVPVATLSLVGADAEVYKSHFGLPDALASAGVLPRALSLCGHIVAHKELLVVDDLSRDSRFADNPLVTQSGARFYAGAPLRTEAGHAIGSLCVIDSEPRHFSASEAGLLQLLADGVMAEIKLRAASRDLHGITRKLAERNRAMERDLDQARAVQRYLLPPARQEGPGYVISHAYHPFDRIGGDFIDAHLRPDGSAVLLLADVAGHGASAALTSAMTKTCFHRHAPGIDEPHDLLTHVNADLAATADGGRFMTALAAVYHPQPRAVRLASAGHPYPIRLRPAQGASQAPSADVAGGSARGTGAASAAVFTTPNDLPLLIEPDRRYTQSVGMELAAGEQLLLYTDGAIEARDGAGDFLGVDGLCRLAAAASTGRRGGEFLAALFERVAAHAAGRLTDDVALMCLECEPGA